MTRRVALVFGGSRGIGAACVESLAAQGFDVAYTYVSSAPDGARAQDRKAYRADVGAPDDVAQAFAAAQRDFGAPVHCVVANAGIGAPPLSPLNRVGAPQEVAAVVGFLPSDAASWVDGQIVQPNGGWI